MWVAVWCAACSHHSGAWRHVRDAGAHAEGERSAGAARDLRPGVLAGGTRGTLLGHAPPTRYQPPLPSLEQGQELTSNLLSSTPLAELERLAGRRFTHDLWHEIGRLDVVFTVSRRFGPTVGSSFGLQFVLCLFAALSGCRPLAKVRTDSCRRLSLSYQ